MAALTETPAKKLGWAAADIIVLLYAFIPVVWIISLSLKGPDTLNDGKFLPGNPVTTAYSDIFKNDDFIRALINSIGICVISTFVALVLGTMAALALQRFRFFGRDTVSLLIILPIALPGVVTGVALANFFTTMIGIQLGMFTLIVSHATFCIVTVFNNAVARLRRLGSNLEEASMDLGAGTFRTFYKITLPMLRSSLLAGCLLAFALSFDEIIVTTFTVGQGIQTLPIWIYQNLFRPNQAPVVNVVAAVLILASIVPIWLAQKLAGTDESVAAAR